MTPQTRTHAPEPFLAAKDESWQAFFFAGDSGREGLERTPAQALNAWTTDQLLSEVLVRRADDASALRLMQGTILRALLSALDRKQASARR